MREPAARYRFQREACATSALNHPNICTVHHIGEHDGQPFLVMEFLEGRTLGEYITGKPLQLKDLLDLSIQTADALDAAHARGIVHRWLQPIAGGEPRQITSFKADSIFSFDVSRDGRQLVMSRGTTNYDVMLLRNKK